MDPQVPAQNTPITPPTEPITPSIPVQSKNNWLILVIFLVVGILVGIGGLLVYQKYFAVKPIAVASPTPVVTADPTADWKTYTNTKYNYSFKYPENYSVGQNGFGSDTPEIESHIVAYNSDSQDSTLEPRIAVSITDKTLESLTTQAQRHFNKVSTYKLPANSNKEQLSEIAKSEIEDNQVIEKFTETVFLGTKAYTYTIKGNYVEDGSAESLYPLMEYKYLWFENENNIFQITLSNIDAINQILSTFKFGSTTTSSTLESAKTACIGIFGSSKHWDDDYKECQDSSGNSTLTQKLQTLCQTYQGKFDAQSNTCRHALPGEICGPNIAVVCTF